MKKQKIKSKKKQKEFSYLEKSKNSILIIIIIFVASILLGIINADSLKSIINPILEDLIGKTENLNTIGLITFIFTNNVFSSLLGLFLGIFLGIFPIIVTLTNGIILGYVLERTAQISILELWRIFPHGIFELPAVFISLGVGLKLGIDIIKNYWKINKNPIIKILGVVSCLTALLGLGVLKLALNNSIGYIFSLFSFILGLCLIIPFILLFFLTNKDIKKFNLQKIKDSLRIFFSTVIPLLIIAAIIEGVLITIT